MDQGGDPDRGQKGAGQKLRSPVRIARKAISRAFAFFLSTNSVDKKNSADTVLAD
ncbi:hypothetical protein N5C72_06805 [Achromobacter mucicolens]|uniref:Uncharacterized protein n=1 Tax=Achromobacter mucicolens TaxID=1389922 RepID=A0ABD4YRA4_9BURK|nr:hypothetical protein [Achromobacter mucicolens]MDH1177776.1 hypothetical protein [Achromobacter mucicolens]WGJ93025.1 hypothetical protein QEP15_12330 [Achromobacter mucicolens]